MEFQGQDIEKLKKKTVKVLEKNYQLPLNSDPDQSDFSNPITKSILIVFTMTGDIKEENQENLDAEHRDDKIFHMKTQEISNQLANNPGGKRSSKEGSATKVYKDKVTLPFAFVVEMMKDLNDILIKNQLNFFTKITEFLFLKQNPKLLAAN